jgi:hypothetical protein
MYTQLWFCGIAAAVVTGERDKGYIRPSVRNIMLTLGLSQLFLAKNMQKQAEKLLYVVEVAAIEFGSYTKFMVGTEPGAAWSSCSRPIAMPAVVRLPQVLKLPALL